MRSLCLLYNMCAGAQHCALFCRIAPMSCVCSVVVVSLDRIGSAWCMGLHVSMIIDGSRWMLVAAVDS